MSEKSGIDHLVTCKHEVSDEAYLTDDEIKEFKDLDAENRLHRMPIAKFRRWVELSIKNDREKSACT